MDLSDTESVQSISDVEVTSAVHKPKLKRKEIDKNSIDAFYTKNDRLIYDEQNPRCRYNFELVLYFTSIFYYFAIIINLYSLCSQKN